MNNNVAREGTVRDILSSSVDKRTREYLSRIDCEFYLYIREPYDCTPKFTIDKIKWGEDDFGHHWIGTLLRNGTPYATTGTFYDMDESGLKRLSKEDQIVDLLFNPDVIDPAYRTTLIYDGDRGFCRRTAKWVREMDKKLLLRIVPLPKAKDHILKTIKTDGIDLSLFRFVYNDFYIFNQLYPIGLMGMDAATELCEFLFGPGNWLASLMCVRPIKWLLRRVHYWVMDNRRWLIRFWNTDEVIDESVNL